MELEPICIKTADSSTTILLDRKLCGSSCSHFSPIPWHARATNPAASSPPHMRARKVRGRAVGLYWGPTAKGSPTMKNHPDSTQEPSRNGGFTPKSDTSKTCGPNAVKNEAVTPGLKSALDSKRHSIRKVRFTTNISTPTQREATLSFPVHAPKPRTTLQEKKLQKDSLLLARKSNVSAKSDVTPSQWVNSRSILKLLKLRSECGMSACGVRRMKGDKEPIIISSKVRDMRARFNGKFASNRNYAQAVVQHDALNVPRLSCGDMVAQPRRTRRNGLCVLSSDCTELTRKSAALNRGSATITFFDHVFQRNDNERGAACEFPSALWLQGARETVCKLPNMFAEIHNFGHTISGSWVLNRLDQIHDSLDMPKSMVARAAPVLAIPECAEDADEHSEHEPMPSATHENSPVCGRDSRYTSSLSSASSRCSSVSSQPSSASDPQSHLAPSNFRSRWLQSVSVLRLLGTRYEDHVHNSAFLRAPKPIDVIMTSSRPMSRFKKVVEVFTKRDEQLGSLLLRGECENKEYLTSLQKFPRRHRRNAFTCLVPHIPIDFPRSCAGDVASSACTARVTSEWFENTMRRQLEHVAQHGAYAVDMPRRLSTRRISIYSDLSSCSDYSTHRDEIQRNEVQADVDWRRNALATDVQMIPLSSQTDTLPLGTLTQRTLRGLTLTTSEHDMGLLAQSCTELKFLSGDRIYADGAILILDKGSAIREDSLVIAGEGDICSGCGQTDFFAISPCTVWKVDSAVCSKMKLHNVTLAINWVVGVLASIPLLRSFSQAYHEKVASALQSRDVCRGEVLGREGFPGNQLCILAEGTCDISKQETVTQTLIAGMWFGEIFLLFEHPHAYSVVVSSERARILTLSRSAHRSLFGPMIELIAGIEGSATESSESESFE